MGSAVARHGSPTGVAVCIVSHRRPESLMRLLGALDGQELPADVRMRVVVVDNDPQESAREVCDAARVRVSYPLTYAAEKRRGIPQARNRALMLALRDDLIAFIDDDEIPEADWLAELVRVQRAHRADAVAGPCLPRFAEEPPVWVVEGGFFERPRFATGEERDVAFTHNVLVTTAALGEMRGLFDERLALCGGEDVEFFRRFVRGGRRIVWADGAVVHDVVPASRTQLDWILRRARRVGASNAWVELRHQRGSARRILCHGAWCLGKGGAQLLAAPARGGAAAAARALALAAFGLGRIQGAFGKRFDEYR